MRLLQSVRCRLLVIFLVFATAVVYPQSLIHPYHGLKSHETLIIRDIELSSEKTVVSFSIENRIEGGNFCADKNIYLIDPEGAKLKLTKSAGIPQCPDYYKFKNIGEKLQFVLEFPPLKNGVKWIDIIEHCNENCFSFYGIVLDNALNRKIDEAVSLAEKGETIRSIEDYRNILSEISGKKNGIEGSIYSDIITLLVKTGKTAQAKEWYDKMILSKSPRLEMHIKNLNSRGIRF